MTDPITVERDGQVLLMGINRPAKRNAFNLAAIEALGAAYETLGTDGRLRAGVLFAHGDHFSAGLDLAEVGPAGGGKRTRGARGRRSRGPEAARDHLAALPPAILGSEDAARGCAASCSGARPASPAADPMPGPRRAGPAGDPPSRGAGEDQDAPHRVPRVRAAGPAHRRG